MFNSWWHIDYLAREFERLISGAVCGAPFTYQKNHLHIPLEGAGDWRSVHFCVQTPLPFLTLENTLPQPKRKVAVLRDLAGKTIISLICQENDRQILLSLNGGAGLLFRLYGINGNVFLLNQDGVITDSFKKMKKPLDFDLPGFRQSRHRFPDHEHFTALLEQYLDQSLATFLTKSLQPVLPKTLMTEICGRSGLPPNKLLVNLNTGQLVALELALNALATEIQSPTPRIYTGEPPVFSLTELRSLKEQPLIEFDTLISAQNQFIQTFLNRYRLTERKKALLRQTELLLSAAQRKLISQRHDLADLPTAANYRQWADTLMATAPTVPPFSRSVTLTQLTDETCQITIPLDPKLSPIANAQRYYAKSRQIEASRTELAQKITETEDTIRKYELLRQQIADTTEFKSLRSLAAQLPMPTQSQNSVESIHQPFTNLNLAGWEILIGKSAHDNDELLRTFARPADFWFHAQGTSGSHVIVRNPGKVPTLPRNIQEKVAGLAAFHSKAKHSTVVPIILTQCKYVSKPRHAAPGAVVVQFEKTLVVEPLDPKKLVGLFYH